MLKALIEKVSNMRDQISCFSRKNQEYKKGSNSNLKHRDTGMLNFDAWLHSAFKDVLKLYLRQRRRNIL